MAQFDVHKNTAPSKSYAPYLLDVQADLLQGLATRLVIPLVKPAALGNRLIGDLHVEVEVDGHRFIAVTSELAAIPRTALGARVASLAHLRTDLVRSIGVIISGV